MNDTKMNSAGNDGNASTSVNRSNMANASVDDSDIESNTVSDGESDEMSDEEADALARALFASMGPKKAKGQATDTTAESESDDEFAVFGDDLEDMSEEAMFELLGAGFGAMVSNREKSQQESEQQQQVRGTESGVGYSQSRTETVSTDRNSDGNTVETYTVTSETVYNGDGGGDDSDVFGDNIDLMSLLLDSDADADADAEFLHLHVDSTSGSQSVSGSETETETDVVALLASLSPEDLAAAAAAIAESENEQLSSAANGDDGVNNDNMDSIYGRSNSFGGVAGGAAGATAVDVESVTALLTASDADMDAVASEFAEAIVANAQALADADAGAD